MRIIFYSFLCQQHHPFFTARTEHLLLLSCVVKNPPQILGFFFDSCLDELKAKSKRVVMSLSNILLLRASISILQYKLSLRYFESLSLVTLYHENLYPRAPVDDKIHTFDDNINENE